MATTRLASHLTSRAAFVLVLALASTPAFADVSDPAPAAPAIELGFGLRGVLSGNGYLTAPIAPTFLNPAGQPAGSSGVLDFSDTYLYVRPRLLLYQRSLRIGALFALTFPDVYFQPGTPFLAEAKLTFESRYVDIHVGRTRIMSSIVSFPTLRDDDLIRFTDTQNPFSNGQTSADHQFGNAVEVFGWFTPRWFLDAHAENLSNNILQAESLGAFELNLFGADLGYQQIPSLARISIVRRAGLGVNLYHVDDSGKTLAVEALGGVWLNLLRDPIHNIDWRAQVIYNDGAPRAMLASLNDTFRARQVSAVSALQYDYRRQLLPTFRAAVVGAYKRYIDLGIDQWSVVGNAFYSLGLGVDVGMQYEYHSPVSIPAAFDDRLEHVLKLAMIARFELLFNRQFDTRDSLLNTQSGYLP